MILNFHYVTNLPPNYELEANQQTYRRLGACNVAKRVSVENNFPHFIISIFRATHDRFLKKPRNEMTIIALKSTAVLSELPKNKL